MIRSRISVFWNRNTARAKDRQSLPAGKFLFSFLLGLAFFLLPVSFGGKLTVPFDVFITLIRKSFPLPVEIYTFIIVFAGALMSLAVRIRPRLTSQFKWLNDFQTSTTILSLRLIGLVMAILLIAHLLPDSVYQAGIYHLIWKVLAVSVALIIPLGAIFVQLFVTYGGMDFLGTLAEPLMKPLFRLPGRAALDALTSWVGSYSVGLYLTRTVFLGGGYSRRQAFTLATCFSTVSIGFVGVICATLNLLHLFPMVLIFYFFSIVLLAILLVRIPPVSRISNSYFVKKTELQESAGEVHRSLLSLAWQRALQQTALAPPLVKVLPAAVADGLRLAGSIIGTIVAVGTVSLAVAKFTPVFNYLGLPLIPVLKWWGIPQPNIVAPAVLVEITEMYIPALLVVDTPEMSRFFIAVLSTSQLIFFSSLGPMIIDMFREIPVKFSHLILLFVLRTAILIPFLIICIKILQVLNLL